MKKIGFLGLGIMGYGMAVNLIRKSGTPIIGFDLVESARERFREAGGLVTKTAEELYQKSDILFFCLPTNDIVKKTVPEMIKHVQPGTILADMGSTSPAIIRELHIKAAAEHVCLMDCPVSGGETGAMGGSLSIMSGGEKYAFDEILPYLKMMGSTVTYMGISGCGSTAKVVNNLIVGVELSAVGEAFALAVKAGLDPKLLFGALRGGFAQNAVMDLKVPKILSRDFTASARIAVHFKDIKNAVDLAENLNVELPLTEIVKEQMQWIEDNGMIDEDQCAMIKYYENAMQTTVE